MDTSLPQLAPSQAGEQPLLGEDAGSVGELGLFSSRFVDINVFRISLFPSLCRARIRQSRWELMGGREINTLFPGPAFVIFAQRISFQSSNTVGVPFSSRFV